jgi:hypothetical protein
VDFLPNHAKFQTSFWHKQPTHPLYSMKKPICSTLLSVAACIPSWGNPTYQYPPDSLPQDSQPSWTVLGGSNLRGEIVEGALLARTEKASWSQWRIGTAPGGGREFGDATALQIPDGGALTVDFTARLLPENPELPILSVALSNGACGSAVTFSPGSIAVSGVRTPIPTDTATWGAYRMVVEGTQFEFFCANTQTSLKAELTPSDWGKYINFGFPALEGQGEGIARAFEIKSIKWQPGVADRQFPAAAQE